MDYKWVTKFVNRKEWMDWYSYHPIYTMLRQVKGGYILGFSVIGDEIPIGHQEATLEEIIQIANDRRSRKIYPIPVGH